MNYLEQEAQPLFTEVVENWWDTPHKVSDLLSPSIVKNGATHIHCFDAADTYFGALEIDELRKGYTPHLETLPGKKKCSVNSIHWWYSSKSATAAEEFNSNLEWDEDLSCWKETAKSKRCCYWAHTVRPLKAAASNLNSHSWGYLFPEDRDEVKQVLTSMLKRVEELDTDANNVGKR